jgi:hypothetical protein
MERAMLIRRAVLALLLPAVLPVGVSAQSVMVDEGTFDVTVHGRPAGTEEFTIRRAGMGGDAIVIANAVVSLETDSGTVELRPLLQTVPPDGAASSYQLKVSGAQSEELSLALAGRRYVSRIRTAAGEEEREFLARAETRILEEAVAHQYYFLHGVDPGQEVPVIEPRTRRQFQLKATASDSVEIRIGSTPVPARRVTFENGADTRTVWFDRQGRVLRVEVPARAYVAQRKDLVG